MLMKDERFLKRLMDSCRCIDALSVGEIAEKVGFSRPTIYACLNRLIAKGILEVKAIINDGALGFKTFLTSFAVPKGVYVEYEVFDRNGSINIVKAREIEDDFVVHSVPVKAKLLEDYLAVERKGLGEVDEKDIMLLTSLHAKNEITPLKKIAKDLNMSVTGIYYRLRRLKEKGILLGYRFMVNWEKTPLNVVKLIVKSREKIPFETFDGIAYVEFAYLVFDERPYWYFLECSDFTGLLERLNPHSTSIVAIKRARNFGMKWLKDSLPIQSV